MCMSDQLSFINFSQEQKITSSDIPREGKPKLRPAIRNQVEIRTSSLDDLLVIVHNQSE